MSWGDRLDHIFHPSTTIEFVRYDGQAVMLRFVVRHTNGDPIAVATTPAGEDFLPFGDADAKLLGTLANYPTNDSKLPTVDQ